MDLAALELQIFVSLAVVLGVAFVALLCDFLKGNNERLRERNIEYRVRETERGASVSASELLQGIVAIGQNPELARKILPGAGAASADAPATPVVAAEPAPERGVSTWATKEELERLAERAARIRARHEARKPEPVPAPPSQPAEAAPPAASEPTAEPDVPQAKILPIDFNSAERYEPVPEASLQPAALPEPPPVAAEPEPQPALPSNIPAGLQPVAALNSLMEANTEFTGVAVSIGINDFDALRDKIAEPESADSLAAIEHMVRSAMTEASFGCRFQEDEYILLFSGETEAVAQRRLFQISEKVWDFQLRSLGHHSVMFSWGGLEVHRESLREAVASARERMFQTKRGRKGGLELKRKIVNG